MNDIIWHEWHDLTWMTYMIWHNLNGMAQMNNNYNDSKMTAEDTVGTYFLVLGVKKTFLSYLGPFLANFRLFRDFFSF
jgi:hypothetical protein